MIYAASSEKLRPQFVWTSSKSSTCGLVAMTSASHAEGRQFDPGQVYLHSDLHEFRQADALAFQPKCSCVRECGGPELRAAKDRDAKDRDAKDRDAKDRDAKDRSRRERGERERERGWPARSAAPAGGTLTKTAFVPLEGAGSSFLFIFGE